MSKKLDWFRMYHEVRTNPKLTYLEDDVFRVWFNLLVYASEQPVRGVISGKSPFVLALHVAKGNEELLNRSLSVLEKSQIILRADEDISFPKFKDWQYVHTCNTPEEVNKRVKKHNKNKQQINNPLTTDKQLINNNLTTNKQSINNSLTTINENALYSVSESESIKLHDNNKDIHVLNNFSEEKITASEDSLFFEDQTCNGNVTVTEPLRNGHATEHVKVPYESISTLWNKIVGSPKVSRLTDPRKVAIRSRWNESPDHQNKEFWVNLFKKVTASDFLSGRDGKWQGCCFDWVLKPANFVKIVEGNYTNKTPAPGAVKTAPVLPDWRQAEEDRVNKWHEHLRKLSQKGGS